MKTKNSNTYNSIFSSLFGSVDSKALQEETIKMGKHDCFTLVSRQAFGDDLKKQKQKGIKNSYGTFYCNQVISVNSILEFVALPEEIAKEIKAGLSVEDLTPWDYHYKGAAMFSKYIPTMQKYPYNQRVYKRGVVLNQFAGCLLEEGMKVGEQFTEI